MRKIKYCILLMLPVYVFSQGMYQDNSTFGIQIGGSWASNLDSKIKSNSAIVGVSFQSKIDLGYAFAEIAKKGSANSKYYQAKVFSVTIYPITGQTLLNSKFGISVQYIDYQT